MASNLTIIRDNKFTKLFTKRPKHQEIKTISFNKFKLHIIVGLNEPIKTKNGYEKKNLCNEWKLELTQKLDSNIHHLSRESNIKESIRALKEANLKQNLKYLHS